jgi:hypothetical protein
MANIWWSVKSRIGTSKEGSPPKTGSNGCDLSETPLM